MAIFGVILVALGAVLATATIGAAAIASEDVTIDDAENESVAVDVEVDDDHDETAEIEVEVTDDLAADATIDAGVLTLEVEPDDGATYELTTTDDETVDVQGDEFTEDSDEWTVDLSGDLETTDTSVDTFSATIADDVLEYDPGANESTLTTEIDVDSAGTYSVDVLGDETIVEDTYVSVVDEDGDVVGGGVESDHRLTALAVAVILGGGWYASREDWI